ncbi:MAG: DUF4433 domain-containing protein [Methylococcales bacterium]
MSKMPRLVRLFHITAIDNLAAIFKQGTLLCKQHTDQQGIAYQNIAHAGAQSARAHRPVIDPPGGSIHDYVPFYFAPRSPMLSAIHNSKVKNCSYRQEDIVHFELFAKHAKAEGMKAFVFYDRNATKCYSKSYTDPAVLKDVVDWGILTEEPTLDGFCKYFHDRHDNPEYIDRMEKRQAEFLIKDQVPVAWFSRIGVINETKAQKVRCLMERFEVNLRVDVMTDWYFLEQ